MSTNNVKPRIYYTKPSITEREVGYATDAATHGWGAHCYDYILRFEELFRNHLGVRYAIATSSGTGALHLGMAALGIGQGDEVILGDINWIASAAPIVNLGATPVMVDVLRDTWCLDPAAVESAITPRTKAILATHLYGNLCDLDALLAIGQRRGIPVIEDAAEALGSVWHGRRAGSMGVFGAFSFHGTKTVTTGEGGIFVTNDEKLYEDTLTLSNHGRARNEARQFWPVRIGFKYKMSNLQAAIGCAQMERLEELLAAKRRIFQYYDASLSKLPIRMNPEPLGTTNGFWMPTLVVDQGVKFERQPLLDRFKSENIDARVFFWPLSKLPMFKEIPQNRLSYAIYPRAINLPTYHDITREEQDRVIGCVVQALSAPR